MSVYKGDYSVSEHLDKHRKPGTQVIINQSIITAQLALSQVLGRATLAWGRDCMHIGKCESPVLEG